LRWGIISTGRIARVFAEHLPTSNTGRLVAVASRDAARVSGFGDVRAHGSYEQLLADADVDAVYIATPHPMHARWAIAAAEAGKHVLCEKPLTMNAAEAQDVVDAARRSGVFLMEAFMYRCHPQTAKLVELLRARAVGEVRGIEAVHSFRAPDVPDSRLLANALGGGGIMDVGCYCASGSRLVAGAALGLDDAAEPIDVQGSGHVGVTNVDDWATATLRFDGGITAQLATGIRVDQQPLLRVVGSQGSIVLHEPWLPDVRGATGIVIKRAGHTDEVIRVPTDRGLYAYQVDVLAEAVQRGAAQAAFPACTWADSLANARTLDRWRAAVGVTYEADRR
jgi:predicted dehydrogenase